eukprot:TRINITY_DN14487_c0_g1_i1.p1 TRINITY_DN14487_c0_g1~~TRINITY_DN14487_c0_g1_i1.p1  ORF type:complete len:563 (+),score=116.06 TRINITY_DN14487_c0_g1_i1:68-1756(+)
MSGSDQQDEDQLLSKILSELEVIRSRLNDESVEDSKVVQYLSSLSDNYLKQTNMNEEPFNNAWHNAELCEAVVKRLSHESTKKEPLYNLITLLLICIRVLSRESRNKTALVAPDTSAVQVISHTMQLHSSQVSIQQHSCACLANLMSACEPKQEPEQENPSELYSKLIRQVISTITIHQNSAPLQEEGIAALINFQWNSTANRKLVSQLGGISLLLRAFKLFPNDPGVNEQVCRAICLITDDKITTEKLVYKGIITTLISILKTHYSNPSVLENGFSALQRLSITGGLKVQALIGEEGGIPIVLRAIRNHPFNPIVCIPGCKLLCILVNSDEVNRRDVSEDGGITDVMNLMKNLRANQNAMKEAVTLLHQLSLNDEASKQIVREGGIRSLCKVMTNHSEVPLVQELAMETLASLTSTDKNHVKSFLQLGGLGTVINSMNKHLTVVRVQEAGCGVLFGIARIGGNEAKITEQGAIKAIIQAMTIHEDNVDVQRVACLVISTLVMGPNASVKKAMGRESIEALLQSLKKHAEDAKIQEKGCNALMNIVLDGDEASSTYSQTLNR